MDVRLKFHLSSIFFACAIFLSYAVSHALTCEGLFQSTVTVDRPLVAADLQDLGDLFEFRRELIRSFSDHVSKHPDDPLNFPAPKLQPLLASMEEFILAQPKWNPLKGRMLKRVRDLKLAGAPYRKTVETAVAFTRFASTSNVLRRGPRFSDLSDPISVMASLIFRVFPSYFLRWSLSRPDLAVILPSHKNTSIPTMNRLFFAKFLVLGINQNTASADGIPRPPMSFEIHDRVHSVGLLPEARRFQVDALYEEKIRTLFWNIDRIHDNNLRAAIEAILFVHHEGRPEMKNSGIDSWPKRLLEIQSSPRIRKGFSAAQLAELGMTDFLNRDHWLESGATWLAQHFPFDAFEASSQVPKTAGGGVK